MRERCRLNVRQSHLERDVAYDSPIHGPRNTMPRSCLAISGSVRYAKHERSHCANQQGGPRYLTLASSGEQRSCRAARPPGSRCRQMSAASRLMMALLIAALLQLHLRNSGSRSPRPAWSSKTIPSPHATTWPSGCKSLSSNAARHCLTAASYRAATPERNASMICRST